MVENFTRLWKRRCGVIATVATIVGTVVAVSTLPASGFSFPVTTKPAASPTTSPSTAPVIQQFCTGISPPPGCQATTTSITGTNTGITIPGITTLPALPTTTTIPGATTTTVPGATTTVTTLPAPPAASRTVYHLPTYYYPVTTEGVSICKYQPGEQVSTTLAGPLGSQLGPTITADSKGCVDASLRYIGNGQFQAYLGLGQWTKNSYTLSPGQNDYLLTGTAADGKTQLTSDIQFDLGNVPGLGRARSIKGKGVSWLGFTVIAAILIDLLLFATGLALHVMSRRRMAGAGTGEDNLDLAGRDDDEEEEEPFFDNELAGEPPPVPELPRSG